MVVSHEFLCVCPLNIVSPACGESSVAPTSSLCVDRLSLSIFPSGSVLPNVSCRWGASSLQDHTFVVSRWLLMLFGTAHVVGICPQGPISPDMRVILCSHGLNCPFRYPQSVSRCSCPFPSPRPFLTPISAPCNLSRARVTSSVLPGALRIEARSPYPPVIIPLSVPCACPSTLAQAAQVDLSRASSGLPRWIGSTGRDHPSA